MRSALVALATVLCLFPACDGAAPPPFLPDPALTPGAVRAVTVRDIAQPGYARRIRNVSESTKEKVFQEYGIAHPARGEYEIDHLISLELGGSNSIKNLWPESYKSSPWNAHVKDQLEDRLHALVVAGKVDLKTAQQDEAQDWVAAYRKYFHTMNPVASHMRHSSLRHTRTAHHRTVRHTHAAPASSGPMVWVNTNTGVYHYPGTRWYENTKQGQLMPESQARAEGDRPVDKRVIERGIAESCRCRI